MLITEPQNITVSVHEVAQMTCTYNASQIPHLSVCAWTKGSSKNPIEPSEKHQFNKTLVPGRDYQLSCTLTVSDAINTDEGKYFCSCYYNQSFWGKYHVPKYSNIISQKGEISLQVTHNTGKSYHNFSCGYITFVIR